MANVINARHETELGIHYRGVFRGAVVGDELDEADGPNRSEPLVRPFGYVADRAVIRCIGDRELFLGNRYAADPARHDREFEFVLTLATDEAPSTTHHHPLVDGPGNDWGDFAAAVDTARRLHRQDDSLLIHCTAGISRSSTLVATTLAAEEGRTLADAFETVRDARPHALAHPALYELAVVYLAAQPG